MRRVVVRLADEVGSDNVERMRRILLAVPVLALVAAACTDTGSYKDQTEKFINDDAGIERLYGEDLTDTECVEPTSTDVGTTYTCTAQLESGTAEFEVLIDAEDSFAVTPLL